MRKRQGNALGLWLLGAVFVVASVTTLVAGPAGKSSDAARRAAEAGRSVGETVEYIVSFKPAT